MTDKLMTTKEVAKYLGVSRQQVYNLVKLHGLPYVVVGKRKRFILQEVDEWLNKGRNQPAGA